MLHPSLALLCGTLSANHPIEQENAKSNKRRRQPSAPQKVLKMAKGYYGARKNVWTVAKNAVEKGLTYAYVGRKLKKRQFRSLWIQRINAGARQHGMSYSQFMGKLSQVGHRTEPQGPR